MGDYKETYYRKSNLECYVSTITFIWFKDNISKISTFIH